MDPNNPPTPPSPLGQTIPKIPDVNSWHWSFRRPATPLARASVIYSVAALSKLFLYGLTNTTTVNLETLNKLARDRGNRPLITYSNHASLLDDPSLFALLPWSEILDHRKVRWTLGSQKICFSHPVTAWFFRAGKAFATEDGKGIYQGSMEKALEKLNQNDWVHVFPEAKIVQDGTIHPFRWGIGRLIMESKTPPIVVPFFHKIVMIFAKGMERIMPTYTLLRPRPLQKLFFMVGEPIDFAEHHHLWEDLKKDFERQKELHRTFEDYDAQKVRIQIVQMLKDKLESLRSEGLKMIENQK